MKQITFMIKNKYNPCVEFEFPEKSIAVAATLGMGMDSRSSSTFYANRYWSMWKLPMYGATDAESVMAECKKCAKAFPNAFVRLVGFDANRQVRATPRGWGRVGCPPPPHTHSAFRVAPETKLTRPSPPAPPLLRPQTQMVGFIVHRPAGGEALPVNQRSIESN